MSHSIARSLKLRVVAAPLVVVALLQASGCTQQATPPPPPGGTYLSTSAGGHFDQSVALATGEGNIAQLTLLKAHRPAHSPQLIYIGAGEDGIVKSENGGVTWTLIATPLTAVSDVVQLENGILVAAGINNAQQGLIIRSSDGGRSWESTLTIPIEVDTSRFKLIGQSSTPGSAVVTIELDPFDQNRVYAGSNLGSIFVGEQSAKTWRSHYTLRNGNFGASERRGFSIRRIIPSPHKANTLLVLTSANRLYEIRDNEQIDVNIPQNLEAHDAFSTGGVKQVYDATYIKEFPQALFVGVNDGAVITRDNGKTWTQLKLPLDNSKTFNTATVAASPTNSSRLFVGINSVVYRSEDGGRTWNTFSFGLLTHGITALLIDPTNASRVLAVMALLRS